MTDPIFMKLGMYVMPSERHTSQVLDDSNSNIVKKKSKALRVTGRGGL
jgi:hypothetical protein